MSPAADRASAGFGRESESAREVAGALGGLAGRPGRQAQRRVPQSAQRPGRDFGMLDIEDCVCPGPTDTPLSRNQPERIKEALTRAIPFRRIALPEKVADAILVFASDRAAYVTGQVLGVSGGLTMAG